MTEASRAPRGTASDIQPRPGFEFNARKSTAIEERRRKRKSSYLQTKNKRDSSRLRSHIDMHTRVSISIYNRVRAHLRALSSGRFECVCQTPSY